MGSSVEALLSAVSPHFHNPVSR